MTKQELRMQDIKKNYISVQNQNNNYAPIVRVKNIQNIDSEAHS